MSTASVVLIAVGLFLFGGVISFVKQGLPKSVVAVLGIGAAMCVIGGLLRI
jgi:hypothetical protein